MPAVKSIEHLILIALCLAAITCASSGGRAGDRDESPRMLSRAVRPDLRFPTTPGNVRIDVEVEVDESGRADVSTLKVTGAGAAENRYAIEQWIQQVNFAPALRGGVPVRGVFKTRIEAGVRVRRGGGT